MKLLTKIALFVMLVPISLVVLRYGPNAVLQIEQTQLIKRNSAKVKVGMTSSEVEALLGWPDVIQRFS